MFGKLELPKLSDNEKKLLLFGVILVIAFLYIMTIFMPHYNLFMGTKTQYDTLIKKEKNYKVTLTRIDEVQSKFKGLIEKTKNNYSKFYPYISQEKFIDELSDIANKTGIGKLNYIFLEETCESFEGAPKSQSKPNDGATKSQATPNDEVTRESSFDVEYKKLQMKNPAKAKPMVSQKASTDADLTFNSMQVTVEFRSTYDAAFAYISELSKRPRRPVIYDANISLDKDNVFKTTLILKFFAIPFVESDNAFDKWNYNNPYGKQNPFATGGIFITNTAPVNSKTGEKENSSGNLSSMPVDGTKYDLFVSAKPITADVPTIIVGKGGDSGGTSYAYSDAETVEDVSITISGSNGNYVATYNTSKETKSNIPLSPSGQILSLTLISSARVSNTDISGINLTVNNSTNIKLVINKKDEDPTRPRIKLSTIGDVLVK